MGWGVAISVAGVFVLGALGWTVETRRRRREEQRRAIAERLESLFNPLWQARERTEKMWHDALGMPAAERQQWLQARWKPAIEHTHALLEEHAELRDEAAVIERYLHDLCAHLDANDDEPPYPWDVLDELALRREELRKVIA